MIDMIDANDLRKFRNYVKMFYSVEHPDVVYPIATDEEIDEAINEYIESLPNSDMTWGYGDSLDRERVRMILEPEYSILIPA